MALPSSSLPATVGEIENPRGRSEGGEHRVSIIHIISSGKNAFKLEKRIVMNRTQRESDCLVQSCSASLLCFNSVTTKFIW